MNFIYLIKETPKERIKKDKDFQELYLELKKIFEKDEQPLQAGTRSSSL